MTCHVLTIQGPPQSGKTTMALGMLERLHREGVPVAYVLQSLEYARDAQRRTHVPTYGWGQGFGTARAVVFEDFDRWPEDVRRFRVLKVINDLNGFPGPTQLVIVRTAYEVT